jgi:hypothetical protein
MIRAWDSGVFVCETCDNYLLWEHYDAEARMCKACAKVMEEKHG